MSTSDWTFRNSRADVLKADAELRAEARSKIMARWEPVWNRAGILADLLARFGEGGIVPTRAMAALTVTIPDRGCFRAGGLVALRDGELPDASNQHLRRIVHMNRSRSHQGRVDLDLGPPLPRSEWPEAMRHATAPTEHSVHVHGLSVRLVDRFGFVLSESDAADAHVFAAHLRCVLEAFAVRGRLEAHAGMAGSVGIRPGKGGKGLLGRTWQLIDRDGTVVHAEPRSFLQRRPPQRVATVLAAARAGYADGLAEPGAEAAEAVTGLILG